MVAPHGRSNKFSATFDYARLPPSAKDERVMGVCFAVQMSLMWAKKVTQIGVHVCEDLRGVSKEARENEESNGTAKWGSISLSPYIGKKSDARGESD